MPTDTRSWKRVNRSRRCPICDKSTWCTISEDGTVVCCMRVEQGSFKMEDLGHGLAFFHRIGEAGHDRKIAEHLRPKPEEKPGPPMDLKLLADIAIKQLDEERLEDFAISLGLSTAALTRLSVGWLEAARLRELGTKCRSFGAWSFPMFDPAGPVNGIRLRTPDGFKYAIAGGSDGLFIPDGLATKGSTLVVCEGPTDTAAVLDMGLEAVGRSSCSGGHEMLRMLVHLQQPSTVIILHDRDEPSPDADEQEIASKQRARDATERGAQRLTEAIRSPRRDVWIIQPPPGIKDARQWLKTGANADDLFDRTSASPPIRAGRHDYIKRARRSQRTGETLPA